MQQNDLSREGEPESETAGSPGLEGEEKALDVICVDSGSVVRNPYHTSVRYRLGLDEDSSRWFDSRNGFDCISEEILDDHAQKRHIPENDRRRGVYVDRDVLSGLASEPAGNVTSETGEIDLFSSYLDATREREESGDRFGEHTGLSLRRLDFLSGFLAPLFALSEAEVAEHGRQRVPELVRDSGRDLSEVRQSLQLSNAFLERPDGGQIREYRDEPEEAVGFITKRNGGESDLRVALRPWM